MPHTEPWNTPSTAPINSTQSNHSADRPTAPITDVQLSAPTLAVQSTPATQQSPAPGNSQSSTHNSNSHSSTWYSTGLINSEIRSDYAGCNSINSTTQQHSLDYTNSQQYSGNAKSQQHQSTEFGQLQSQSTALQQLLDNSTPTVQPTQPTMATPTA